MPEKDPVLRPRTPEGDQKPEGYLCGPSASGELSIHNPNTFCIAAILIYVNRTWLIDQERSREFFDPFTKEITVNPKAALLEAKSLHPNGTDTWDVVAHAKRKREAAKAAEAAKVKEAVVVVPAENTFVVDKGTFVEEVADDTWSNNPEEPKKTGSVVKSIIERMRKLVSGESSK